MNDTMRPFYCGSQYGDWTDANCRDCRKGADPDNPPLCCGCDIEQALLEAYCGDGRIPLPIARRMGAVQNRGRYGWTCGEFEEKEQP